MMIFPFKLQMTQSQQIIKTEAQVNNKRSRKNSTQAKQHLLHIWESEYEQPQYYIHHIRSRNNIVGPPFFARCLTKQKAPKQTQQQPDKSLNFLNFLTTKTNRTRNGSRCGYNYNSQMAQQKSRPKKVLLTPKINIGKYPWASSTNKQRRQKPTYQNRIKIVIKNCGDLKKQSQRLKTCF